MVCDLACDITGADGTKHNQDTTDGESSLSVNLRRMKENGRKWIWSVAEVEMNGSTVVTGESTMKDNYDDRQTGV